MQIKGKYSWLKHIDFMVVDLISLFLSFLLSYLLKFGSIRFYASDDWTRYLFIVLVLSLLINLFINPYSGIFRRSYYMELVKAFQLSIYNLLFASLVFFVFKIGATYSREMSFYMYGFYFIFSAVLKLLWKELLVTGKVVVSTTKRIPLFIISDKDSIEKNVRSITGGSFKLYEIVGIHLINDENNEGFLFEGNVIPKVGGDYCKHILDNNIGEVLVAISPELVEDGVLEKLNSNAVGINILVEAVIGFQPEDQFIQNVGTYKSLSIGAFSFTPGQVFYLGIKRLIDIFAGLVGLLLLIPTTIIIKVATLVSGDKDRIFYNQVRVGQNGKIIRIWKYRSMVPNAGEMLQEMLKDPEYKRQWDENQKFDNDPRITKIGRVLRKTSIDELPQLINVLKGDMSLVGPRPLVVGELELHGGLKLYEKVKPGITGWWGCNGRSNLEYRERLELEYYYVKNCGLYLDLLCLFRTALAVIKKDGAQ